MRTSTGASYYYTTDALGSVILITDTNQWGAAHYTYDSWGNSTGSYGPQAATNPWTYAGGYKDTTTGYTKFGARYYNPTTGRFTQPDPSGQEQNRYLYAAANPINNTDPTGLYTWGDFWGGIGGSVLSGVGGTVAGAVTKTTPAGLIAGAAVGCFGGALAEGLSNQIDGKPTSVGDVAGACAGGAVSGLLGGVAGNFVRKALI